MREYTEESGFKISAELPPQQQATLPTFSGINYWSLMAIYVVEIICAVIFSIYRMAYFSHSKDTEFGKSKKAKIIVSTGMFVWALPIVWVPMDILLNNHSGISATFNYYITMVIEAYQLLFIWFFAPIMFAYYETDVESTCKRIF